MSQSTPRLIPARPVELKKITWIEAKSFHKAAHHATFKWLLKFQKNEEFGLLQGGFNCFGVTLNRLFMLEKTQMWLNLNNFAKQGWPKLLHSDVKYSLAVIANT